MQTVPSEDFLHPLSMSMFASTKDLLDQALVDRTAAAKRLSSLLDAATHLANLDPDFRHRATAKMAAIRAALPAIQASFDPASSHQRGIIGIVLEQRHDAATAIQDLSALIETSRMATI